jgi:Mg-chelatase subunit ChlI
MGSLDYEKINDTSVSREFLWLTCDLKGSVMLHGDVIGSKSMEPGSIFFAMEGICYVDENNKVRHTPMKELVDTLENNDIRMDKRKYQDAPEYLVISDW